MSLDRQGARRNLEVRFLGTFNYDVTELAAEHCQAEGLGDAASRCRASHDLLSQQLWTLFTFDWSIFINPGGTSNRTSQFLLAKLEFTVAWAVTKTCTAEVRATETAALERLQVLWREWAGYMVTTSPEFEAALDV